MDAMLHKNAPTEDYGTQNMQDINDTGKTYLQTELDTASNGGIITYDFKQKNLYEIEISDFTSDLIPTSDSSASWSSSDADESVFQAHYIVKQIRDKYLSEFNIDFELLHVGANCNNYLTYIVNGADTTYIYRPNAGAFPDATTEEGWIIIGHSESSTLAEYDILGHELGHVFLNEPLDYTYVTAGSLHEGIAVQLSGYTTAIR
jgi:Zn-dependent metalloprotease